MEDAPKNTIPLMWVEMCLSPDPEVRRQGFQLLTNHPDSHGLKITCLLARHLIRDENPEVAKRALFVLGFGVGRDRWSWTPGNPEEREIAKFASDLSRDLSESDVYRLLTLCDQEAFHGPEGLGERLSEVLGCCFETAEMVLNRVIHDQKEPMRRRAHALYLLCGCDDEELETAEDHLTDDARTLDLAQWMLRERQAEDGGQ